MEVFTVRQSDIPFTSYFQAYIFADFLPDFLVLFFSIVKVILYV